MPGKLKITLCKKIAFIEDNHNNFKAGKITRFRLCKNNGVQSPAYFKIIKYINIKISTVHSPSFVACKQNKNIYMYKYTFGSSWVT